MCIVRAERNTPAQNICKRNSNGCNAYSKRKAFQCVLASINLIANRAAFAHAIVVGFCRNKKSRVKHDDQNGHGKKQCCNSILLTTLLFSALLFSAIGANAIQNRFRFVDLKACAFQRAMQKLFRFLFSKMNAFPAYPTG